MEHAHNREQQTAKMFCWPALHTAQLALCVCAYFCERSVRPLLAVARLQRLQHYI